MNSAYRKLLLSGQLEPRVTEAHAHLSCCDLCAWECMVDRGGEKLGVCKSGVKARVTSYGPHLGEEDPLRGRRGSGTIFFARCNLHCQYCQNYEISQGDTGREMEPEEIATVMLELQRCGCHNINFVSPSHVVAQILAATLLAARRGLTIPLVYNTGGYDSLAALQLLDGIIDIYMPDMKYSDANLAQHYSKVRNYPAVNRAAVKEMHRQVGDLELDEDGIAQRGLLVRHLVLPNGLAGTQEIVDFLAKEISPATYLNVMAQYRPAYRAGQFEELNRPPTAQEYRQAVEMALRAGLHHLDERKNILFLW